MERLNRSLESVLIVDGAAPARHIWSRWMDRALAPHEGQMHDRPGLIAANDIDPEGEEDEPSPHFTGIPGQVLRFD